MLRIGLGQRQVLRVGSMLRWALRPRPGGCRRWLLRVTASPGGNVSALWCSLLTAMRRAHSLPPVVVPRSCRPRQHRLCRRGQLPVRVLLPRLVHRGPQCPSLGLCPVRPQVCV